MEKSTIGPNDDPQNDKFRKNFKVFKSRKETPDFSKVLYNRHGHSPNELTNEQNVMEYPSAILDPAMDVTRKSIFLKPLYHWNIFGISRHPGLIIVQNAFSDLGILVWIRRCLEEYSVRPYRTNCFKDHLPAGCESWWKYVTSLNSDAGHLMSQLRWATMGYHHNWDTKEYSEGSISPMPEELQNLCRFILNGVGLSEFKEFRAEAVIVNYYPPGSSLSPHTDQSEVDKEAPLLSFSFGRSAVFLIGGQERSVEPTAIFLNHGDILIMAGESRLCYHAVPRILDEREMDSCGCGGSFVSFISLLEALLKAIDNHESDNEKLKIKDLYIDLTKLVSCEEAENGQNLNFNDSVVNYTDPVDSLLLFNSAQLKAITNYIASSRININVRQVNKSVS